MCFASFHAELAGVLDMVLAGVCYEYDARAEANMMVGLAIGLAMRLATTISITARNGEAQ